MLLMISDLQQQQCFLLMLSFSAWWSQLQTGASERVWSTLTPPRVKTVITHLKRFAWITNIADVSKHNDITRESCQQKKNLLWHQNKSKGQQSARHGAHQPPPHTPPSSSHYSKLSRQNYKRWCRCSLYIQTQNYSLFLAESLVSLSVIKAFYPYRLSSSNYLVGKRRCH